MPQDPGHLLGEPAFEQARGVLMPAYHCTADEAMTLIAEAATKTESAVEDIVADLRSTVTRRAALRVLADPDA